MKRLHLFLLGVLVLLALADRFLQSRQEAERRRAGTLRPLVDIPAEQVQQLQVQSGSQTWTYVLKEGAWRFPAYFDAFALAEGVEYLLDSLRRASGTAYSADRGEIAQFGLTPDRALKLRLQDGQGRLLVEVWIGRGAPGPGANESYARLAGSDTIFHLHANPRLALGQGNPPLLDPRVLPAALGREPIARVEFARPGYPLRSLRRVQTAPAPPALPGQPPQLPSYEWVADFGGQEIPCRAANAVAYVDFLSQLRYEELRDPRLAGGFEKGRLQLIDEEGKVDVLEIGGQEGSTLLRHRQTGQVYAIAPQRAALLFPSRSALLDSLPTPSPYQLATPAGAGRF